MSINALNLVMGPARLYVAPFGSTEPADSAVSPTGYLTPPGGAWTDVGATDGGVTLEIDNTYTALTCDQVIMDVGARLTEMKMQVTAKLAEMTLTNFQTAINNIGTVSVQSSYQTMEIPVGSSTTQPGYIALIVDGWAPMTNAGTPALRRIIVRKVLSQVKASLAFTKKDQDAFDCTWAAYFVSNSINPLHLVDELTL